MDDRIQLGRTSILVTSPLQLTAFIPGASVGKSPLMLEFIDVMPEYASMSGVSSVMLPEMPSSSTIVCPTMSVISPEPKTVMTGSDGTLPGLVIVLGEAVSVMGGTGSAYQNGWQRKLTAKERCGFPRRIFSELIWLTILA
jgi:hypothetical protein